MTRMKLQLSKLMIKNTLRKPAELNSALEFTIMYRGETPRTIRYDINESWTNQDFYQVLVWLWHGYFFQKNAGPQLLLIFLECVYNSVRKDFMLSRKWLFQQSTCPRNQIGPQTMYHFTSANRYRCKVSHLLRSQFIFWVHKLSGGNCLGGPCICL